VDEEIRKFQSYSPSCRQKEQSQLFSFQVHCHFCLQPVLHQCSTVIVILQKNMWRHWRSTIVPQQETMRRSQKKFALFVVVATIATWAKTRKKNQTVTVTRVADTATKTVAS
jgi:hypothetical protein